MLIVKFVMLCSCIVLCEGIDGVSLPGYCEHVSRIIDVRRFIAYVMWIIRDVD